MSDLPTVRIAHPSGEGTLIINEADFDPETHTLAGAAPDAPKKAPRKTKRAPKKGASKK